MAQRASAHALHAGDTGSIPATLGLLSTIRGQRLIIYLTPLDMTPKLLKKEFVLFATQ